METIYTKTQLLDRLAQRIQGVTEWRSRLALLFLILAMTVTGHAQRYMGSLTGQISDPTGAKISGATVTATDTTTHFSTKTVTNESGSYSIPFLTPDTYDIVVTSSGFGTETRTGIVLIAGGSVETNFTLSVGQSNQTVTVSAANSLLDTTSANLTTTFTAKQVTDLPNIGRDPFVLASLSAGAYDATFMTSKANEGLAPGGNSGTAIIGNGVGGSYTMITLNGYTDAPRERISGVAGNYGGFSPSPEAVQEVGLQTAMYDAEYGYTPTIINSVLRSGTNQYHGSLYYIFRNTYLNANTYERVPNQNGTLSTSAPTPRINGTWDQPGAVFDGPVRIPHLYDGRDKTYFMVAYEHIQVHWANTASSTDLVPTSAEAGGDFSALCPGGFNASGVCNAGGGVQIYDPLTLDASNNRTPFPNNIIPSNRISTIGANLVKLFPAPNATVSNTVNYIAPSPVIYQKYYSFTTRVDQLINENNKFNAIYYRDIMNQYYSNMGFPTVIGPTKQDESVWRNTEGGGLDYISILPHNWVLDARVGVIYHPFGLVYAGDPYDLNSLGMSTNGLAYQTFPGLSMSDSYAGLQAASAGQISTDANGQTAIIVSKSIGKHNLRFGFQGYLERYNGANPLSGLGTFSFDRQFTQKNSVNTAVGADASSGNPIASLLLGYPSSGSYAVNVSFAIQQLYPGFFVQDMWRASRRLTFNAGLRWENQLPYTERYNRLNSGFCTTCVNPLQSSVSGINLLGGLQFASPSNRQYYRAENTDWQPRFGVSYAPSSKITFRGGMGLTYINSMASPIGQGFSTSTSYVATTDNTHPATNFAVPFPSGTVEPSGNSLGLATLVGQNLSFIAPNYLRPRLLQWSTSTQVALPLNTVFQLAYVGNHVWDWPVSKNINALPAQYNLGTAANVTYLQTKVPNPLAGQVPANATLNASTIQRQYLLLPFPEFGSLTESYIPSGGSLYNALQATVRKPMGHGLSILGNFTWTHQMDEYQYMNPTDANPERFEDPQPNLFGNLALIYQLPTFSSLPRYERSVVGGWQFNSAFRAYNGPLIGTPSGYVELSDPWLPHHTYQRYFNTCYLNTAGQRVMTTATNPGCDSATSIPAFQQQYSFSLANIGPYMDHVRARAGTRLDVSLFKTFPVYENMTFEVRGEAFNLFNTPVFGTPGLSPGSSGYGVVTLTQQNDPRIIQLTARVNF